MLSHSQKKSMVSIIAIQISHGTELPLSLKRSISHCELPVHHMRVLKFLLGYLQLELCVHKNTLGSFDTPFADENIVFRDFLIRRCTIIYFCAVVIQ